MERAQAALAAQSKAALEAQVVLRREQLASAAALRRAAQGPHTA